MLDNKMSTKLLKWVVSAGSVAAFGLMSANTTLAQQRYPPNIVLLSPRAGDVLTPGDQVTIQWSIDTSSDSDLTGCEQEIYLSTDKGKTIATRLTPEFAFSVTSYTLTVPNLPSKKAMIIMGFGCEGGTSAFESQYPQRQSVFRIKKAPAGLEDVKVASARATTGSSGREVNLKWESSVGNVDHFEVQMSSDRGAHFQTVYIASGQSYTWRVPEELTGEFTFRIIAHKGDGTSIASLMAPVLGLE